MSALGYRPVRAGLRGMRLGPAGPAALVAVAAAAIGYLAHHFSPLEGHAAATAALVVLAAAIVSVGLGAAVATRLPRSLPDVVVAPPGSESLRRAQRDDLDFCTALHARKLDHGFFVALGPRFLRSYNATFLDSPHAAALVVTIGGHPVGALTGVLDARAHRAWMVRHRGLRLVAGAIAALLTRPRPALRFVRTRIGRYARSWWRHRGGAPEAGSGEAAEAIAVLSHLAVLPGARGTGVGGRLTDAFVDAARRSGAERVTLVTLDDEDGAGGFYAKRGWKARERRSTPEGRPLREWSLPLAAEEAAA